MIIFKIKDFLELSRFEEDKTRRLTILSEKEGAKKIGGIFVIVPPKTPAVKYHYHKERESLILIIKGKGKLVVEGKEYFVEEKELIYIPPMKKHKLENTGETELRYLEFFTHPPVSADFIEVE